MPHIRYSFRHRDRRFRQPSEIGHDYFGTPGHDAGITGHTYSESAVTLRRNTQTDEALWRTYIQLTEAEAAFRVHKSDLAMRPIWHHRAERIKAHILICFIGYALWKTLQQWQARAGLGHSPRTILTELSRIHAADVVLPLADLSNRELRIRCVVRPEREQQILLQHLGLELPQRLKPPATPQM